MGYAPHVEERLADSLAASHRSQTSTFPPFAISFHQPLQHEAVFRSNRGIQAEEKAHRLRRELRRLRRRLRGYWSD